MPASDSVNIGVILERRPIDHPWQDHEWRVAAVVPEPPEGPDPDDDGSRRLVVAGIQPLQLHSTEIASYVENLTSPEAALYVVLRAGSEAGSDLPWVLDRVTADPFEAESYSDDDEEILMEKVPMPETVRIWLEAYVAGNYHEEPFRKRKRDKAKVEAYSFGHEPIVELRKRQRSAGGDKSR